MTTSQIILACLLGLGILMVGYLFTIMQFKRMSDHPDEYGKNDDTDSIHISE